MKGKLNLIRNCKQVSFVFIEKLVNNNAIL